MRIYLFAIAAAAVAAGGCARQSPATVSPPPPGWTAYKSPPAPNGTPALGAALAAAAKNPRSANAMCKLGLAYYKLNDYRDAARELSRAIQLAPRSVNLDAYYYLGFSRDALHDPAGGRDAQRAILRSPVNRHIRSDAYGNIGNDELKLGDEEAAIRDYNQSLLLDPGQSSSLVELGYIAMKHGRLEEARGLFVRSAKCARTLHEAAVSHRMLADVYQVLGNVRSARRQDAISQDLMTRALREREIGER